MGDRSRLRSEALAGEVRERPAEVRLHPDPESVADFLHDESKLGGSGIGSLAVPRTVGALRAVLAWHAHQGHRVAVSGARTGVTGGAVPENGAHLVSLAELRGVVRVDAEGDPPTITVLAGTSLAELNAHLAAHHPGLAFPVDPTETSASLGGMVSTNAGGARTYRFGAMREWVQSLTIELASGRTLHLTRGRERGEGGVLWLEDDGGARALEIAPIPKPATKNAIGYGFSPSADAIDLWIGAEGTLGVVSEVTVRLARAEPGRLGSLQFFDRVEEGFAFVSALRAARELDVTAIEFLDARSHALARDSGKPAVDRVLQQGGGAACSIFVEIAFATEDELGEIAEGLERMVRQAGGDPDRSLAGATEGALRDIRAFRHAVPERINAIIAQRRERHPGLHKIATDMAVPDEALGWVYRRYQEVIGGAGLDYAAFGHVGNNHFHVNILPRDEAELARARECYAILAREVVAHGGCVSAEHGIGRIKKGFMAIQYPPAVLDAFRRVKRWADPQWRLNRGVLIDP